MTLSFVIPVYNERETLAALVEGIEEYAGDALAEIWLIDDGSTDGSAETMRALAAKHAAVRVVRFRRNVGKSAALAAGFSRARGDIVFTLDADLQDEPKEIPTFLTKLAEGHDLVCGWKHVRHDPWHKTFPSHIYNGFVARIFNLPLHDVNCGYKAMRRRVAKEIRVYGDLHRLIPVLAAERGFDVTEIPVEHQPRRFGKSKYGLERFSKGALDVLTVWFLRHRLYSPNHYFGKWGVVAWVGGAMLAALSTWLLLSADAVGWRGLAVFGLVASVSMMTAGPLLLAVGLVAELLVRDLEYVDPEVYVAEVYGDEAGDSFVGGGG
ncbi:MAG: glycosyltransferase family 2 protein, partial [Candidatus Hydrogenedentales bacterium]